MPSRISRVVFAFTAANPRRKRSSADGGRRLCGMLQRMRARIMSNIRSTSWAQRQIRSRRFTTDNGYSHRTTWPNLKRCSIVPTVALGSPDTVLYLAALLNAGTLAGIDQGGLPLGSWLQKVFDVATGAGVSVDDWKAAFHLELGPLAHWPQSAR